MNSCPSVPPYPSPDTGPLETFEKYRIAMYTVRQVHPLRASIVVGGSGKSLSLALSIRVGIEQVTTTGEGCSTRADLVAPSGITGPKARARRPGALHLRSVYLLTARTRVHRTLFLGPLRTFSNLLQPGYASTTCRAASQPCTIVERSSG